MVGPCKNCSERFINCHSSCEEYKIWREDLDNIRSRVLKEKLADALAEGFRKDSMLKMQKKHKRT